MPTNKEINRLDNINNLIIQKQFSKLSCEDIYLLACQHNTNFKNEYENVVNLCYYAAKRYLQLYPVPIKKFFGSSHTQQPQAEMLEKIANTRKFSVSDNSKNFLNEMILLLIELQNFKLGRPPYEALLKNGELRNCINHIQAASLEYICKIYWPGTILAETFHNNEGQIDIGIQELIQANNNAHEQTMMTFKIL